MTSLRVATMVLLGLLVVPLAAQQGTLDVGGFELSLGMSQDAVFKQLSTVYDLQSIETTSGSWIVVRRGASPINAVGTVGFTGGRLTFVAKDWGVSSTDEGQRMASSITRALRSIAGQRCEVRSRDDDFLTTATIVCGQREISITAGNGGRLNVASSVSESLREVR